MVFNLIKAASDLHKRVSAETFLLNDNKTKYIKNLLYFNRLHKLIIILYILQLQ